MKIGVGEVNTKFVAFFTIVAAFATVLTLGGGSAQAATCTVPIPYPTIQSAVNDVTCDPIDVAAGAYVENVMIPRSLTLNGAQATNPVAGRTNPLAESTITGTVFPLPDITIQARDVTIDGFSLTNPLQSTGILIKTAGDNALITNNIIDVIGGVSFAGNTQAIYLENGPDNVRVVGNKISRVVGIASSNGGVFIGDSTASSPSQNILIEGNSISDIHSVNRGAYAIHVNNGNGSTNNTGLVIRNNTIDNLIGGGWVHAIGLEAKTPGVVVYGNSISNLAAPPNTAVAVWFENEEGTSFATGLVNENNLDVTIADYGIAVDPVLSMLYPLLSVDGTCNWWGDANGPGPVGPDAGSRVSYNVVFTPWLIAPAPGGACLGGVPSTPGKVTGGGQIESDPIFSPLGDLLSLPALIPSLADPMAQATFGFGVKCCPETGNLEYNDHAMDVRIKVQSIDALVITSSDSCTHGGKHATFGGTAAVTRSTGTTTESFTVDVDDCGEPGTEDTFGIKTDTYSNPPPFLPPSTLIGGNIQIKN